MKKEEENRRLLSREDVENIYGVRKRFLEIAAVKGDGPPMVKIGRLVRYRAKDIDEWIESRIVASTSEVL